jgi:hypothetical protein
MQVVAYDSAREDMPSTNYSTEQRQQIPVFVEKPKPPRARVCKKNET